VTPEGTVTAAEVRERLGHPVIDSDGHLIEYLPLVRDFVAEEQGEGLARRFSFVIDGPNMISKFPASARRALGAMRPPWWALTPSALDRATAMFPRLLRSRLDEVGIDFAFLYPTFGMSALHAPDEEFRAVAARAFNRYVVETCSEVRDRIEPVAVVPAFSPAEALSALEHAVVELGLKSIVLTGLVPRISSSGNPVGGIFDGLGHMASADYDPLWDACTRLGVIPTFHTPAFNFGTRCSSDNYVFNHIGGFAAGAEGAARSLIFGGVMKRFPQLRFCFLEGGAEWAIALCRDLVAHWRRRAGERVADYDPSGLDRALIRRLLHGHASPAVRKRADDLDSVLGALSRPVREDDPLDEFAESGLESESAIRRLFSHQIFAGCEADDPLNRLAFMHGLGHDGDLGVVFASDLGHWDAPEAHRILPELWEQVEMGFLTPTQLRKLTWENPLRARTGEGAGPFIGTAIEDTVRAAQTNSEEGSKVRAREPAAIQGKR
jgi:predicted TIM-barrel fold metal-dependent hydrolase